MKRASAFFGILLLICGVAFLAYITGHRRGVVHANLRSMSYELMAFEEFERSGADGAKAKLGHLINFREDDLNDRPSKLQDWNYWRHVSEGEVQQDNLRRLNGISNQLPQRPTRGQSQAEIDKLQSEQAGAGQPATRPVVEPEGGDKLQPDAEGRSR